MNARVTWLLPLAGGLLVLMTGIAALQAGDRLRNATLQRQAQTDAVAVAANVQETLLGIAARLEQVERSSIAEPPPAEADVTTWYFDGELHSSSERLRTDPALQQQLSDVEAPTVLAPLTTSTGRDLIFLASPRQDGWAGVAIPTDALLGELPESSIVPQSIEIKWQGIDHDGGSIYRADMRSQLRTSSLSFPVPGGTWELGYDSTVDAKLGELRWSLYITVAVMSYAIALLLYRLAIKPRGLAADLKVMNKRFVALNEQFSTLLANREQIQDRVHQLSVSDIVTGLPNRQAFTEHLDTELAKLRMEPDEGPLSIAIVGLKDVEKAERSLGHSVIPTIFPQVAARLEAGLQDSNYIARVNDYQLAILMPGSDSADAIRIAAELTSDGIAGVYEHERGKINIVPRLGIATADDGYTYAANLMDDAISALSDAEADSMRWSLFASDTRDDRVTLIQLESDFKSALENNEFRLHYQPIVHTHSGKPKGFECLVRWQHPVEGLLPPGRFIALSESTGLITELTQWALREAIRQAKDWENLRNLDCYLSVNLSTLDLLHPPLARELSALVAEAGLSPSMFRLEITESMLINNIAQARDMLIQLRDAGFGIMMDDFGTGFSSLSYLRQLPFSAVKIDQSFTQAITWDSKDYGMVRNILSLIHFLEMESIIEGVETEEQHDLLLPLDPVYCQGYLFAKPMTAIDAEEYLAAASVAPPLSALGGEK